MHNNMSHFSLKSLFGAVFLFFAFSYGLKAQDAAKIFKQNCAVCHTLTDQILTGPGLAGVFDRAPKGDWLKNWILNSDKVTKSGDAYAKKLKADFNNCCCCFICNEDAWIFLLLVNALLTASLSVSSCCAVAGKAIRPVKIPTILFLNIKKLIT